MIEQVARFRRRKVIDGKKLFLLSPGGKAVTGGKLMEFPATIQGLAGTVELRGIGTTQVRTTLKKNRDGQWRVGSFSHAVTEAIIAEARSFLVTENTKISCWIEHVRRAEDKALNKRSQ